MKIKVNFSELSSVSGYVNTILSDKTVDEKKKNVIFIVDSEEVTVVGYSPLTFSRTRLESSEIEGVEDRWVFQVKSGELNKIIASYSSLFKTKVEYIELEKNDKNNNIRVIVEEEPINEEDERLAQTGRFMLDSVPLPEVIINDISTEFPEEYDSVSTEELSFYLDSLFPLMINDSSNSLGSKLNFAEDYLFVMSSYISTFFKNALPDAFKKITLGYSSVNFLKKLCDGIEYLNVNRSDKYLCIESGNTQAFLKYQGVKIQYSNHLRMMNTDNGIVLDRLYLKDVLKRMLVSAQDGVAEMNDYGLEVSNKNFNQVVPVNKKKGDVDNLKFKMSVPAIMKTIVGEDGVFPDELFLYFVKARSNGYILFVKDSSNNWFSTLQVRS